MRYGLRQVRLAHQIPVALPGGTAAFVKGPDDEALAATAIAGGEYTFEAGQYFS